MCFPQLKSIKGENTMEKKTTAETLATIIATMLENNVSPWHQPWVNGAPRGINGHIYRGWNAILFGFLNYNDPRYLTFNKCKQMGGNVKKGEKGHWATYWNFIEKKEVDKDTGKVTIKKFPIAKAFYLFNVTQCENLTLKPFFKGNDNNPIEEAEKVWNNWNDKPELYHNTSKAYYTPNDDYISIPEMAQFNSSDEYYATLFHEAIHSTGHQKRCNRELVSYYQNKQSYGQEELIAEIGSQMLCQSIGITKTLDNTVAYCQSWAKAIKAMPANAVLGAAGKAQKAVDYILGVKYDGAEEE